jgi:hypothetical protein
MTKDQRNIAIIVALLPILAFSVLSNLGRKKNKGAGQKTEPLAPIVAIDQGIKASNPQPADGGALESQKKHSENPWGRDPFSSDIYKSGQANPELKLQGISYRKDNVGFAFINNEIVKKGDSINGYEVQEVLKDKVLLKRGSQSFYLTFLEE